MAQIQEGWHVSRGLSRAIARSLSERAESVPLRTSPKLSYSLGLGKMAKIFAVVGLRNTTRSHMRRTRQYTLSQRVSSSMRLPLHTSSPFSAQYRQIACCTNRGKVFGKR